jgi:hypothetical protein
MTVAHDYPLHAFENPQHLNNQPISTANIRTTAANVASSIPMDWSTPSLLQCGAVCVPRPLVSFQPRRKSRPTAFLARFSGPAARLGHSLGRPAAVPGLVFDHLGSPALARLSYPAADLDPAHAKLTLRARAADLRTTPNDLSFNFEAPDRIAIIRPAGFDAGAIGGSTGAGWCCWL